MREQGHLLLCTRGGALPVPRTEARAGQTSPAHLRDSLPDEQGPVAEVCAVSHHCPPHGGPAHGTETGGRDPLTELGDQSSPR